MEEKSADAAETASALTSQLLTNPEVLAAFTQELGSIVGKSSGYIESLPKSVKRRIKALKKLQAELFELESQFYADIHNLECRYSQVYAPVLNKRRDIIIGSLEPTEADCDWELEEHDECNEEDKKKEVQNVSNGEVGQSESITVAANNTGEVEEMKGIPEFWLTIFKNVEELSALVQECDEPILKNLQDVRVKYLSEDNMGFQLEFIFAPNDFFTNTFLTKEYHLRCKPDEQQPLSYEGPEIVKCSGCVIDWRPGKNVTEKGVKQMTKNQKKKIVKKTVKVDSFFNFFSPPFASEDSAEVEDLLMADFELGHLLQERIIPRAVLYFTGEAIDQDDEQEDASDKEEEDGDNYDEGEDPDYEPPVDAKDGPPNCKQQ